MSFPKRLKRTESKDLFGESDSEDDQDSSENSLQEGGESYSSAEPISHHIESQAHSGNNHIESQAHSGNSEFQDFMQELGGQSESQNKEGSLDVEEGNQNEAQDFSQASGAQIDRDRSHSHQNNRSQTHSQHDDENQNESQEGRKDTIYVPNTGGSESTSESSQSQGQEPNGDTYENHVKEPKVIVFITSLLLLFKFCSQCGAPVTEHITNQVGACLTVTTTCLNHHTLKWSSSPKIGSGSKSRYVINILMATVNLTIGGTYESMNKLFSQLRIYSVGKSQYYQILRDTVYNVIWYVWAHHQAEMFDLLRNIQEDIEMVADGSYDSPGFTALYCIVFLYCVNIGKCVAFKVVHKSQTGNASTKMESFGVRCCLEEVLQENIIPARLGTDQCGHVKTMMRDFYGFIKRQNDIWHFIKNVTKDIRAASKTVSCAILGQWETSIANQLWHAFETCNNDVTLLKEKVLSIIGHLCNKHEFPCFEKYKRCEHRDLSTEHPRPWLTYDSEACRKLQEILKGRDGGRFNALEDMAFSMKTHMVESMNNKRIVYSPKRLVFEPKQQMARTILCCLDHNFNSERGQALTKEGVPRFKIQTAQRGGKKWIVKKIMNPNEYFIMDEIRILVLQCIDRDFLLDEMPVDVDIPKNMAQVERPNKEEAISRHISRFIKPASVADGAEARPTT